MHSKTFHGIHPNPNFMRCHLKGSDHLQSNLGIICGQRDNFRIGTIWGPVIFIVLCMCMLLICKWAMRFTNYYFILLNLSIYL